NILQTTARQDEHTGTINAPGNVRWGYGKVNAYAAVQAALATVNTYEYAISHTGIQAIPNPATDYVTLSLPGNKLPQYVNAITTDGRRISLPLEQNRIQCAHLPAGIYVLEIRSDNDVWTTRIV